MNLLLLIILTALKIILVLVVFLTAIAYTVLLERKVLGFIQLRYGPNRGGPWGLLQPLADLLKLLFKEDFTPPGANRVLFILAPVITAVTAFLPFAVIPFAKDILPPQLTIYGYTVDLTVAGLRLAAQVQDDLQQVVPMILFFDGIADHRRHNRQQGLQIISYVILHSLLRLSRFQPILTRYTPRPTPHTSRSAANWPLCAPNSGSPLM